MLEAAGDPRAAVRLSGRWQPGGLGRGGRGGRGGGRGGQQGRGGAGGASRAAHPCFSAEGTPPVLWSLGQLSQV